MEKAPKTLIQNVCSTTSVATFVVLFLCAACGAPPPVPPLTPTAAQTPSLRSIFPYNTSSAPDVRPTLPAPWTLTPTPTSSETLPPTRTSSPEPPPSLADLCATLEVDFPFEEGAVFEADDTLLLFFGTTERWWESPIHVATPDATSPDTALRPTRPSAMLTEPVTVRFLAVHRETGENLGAEVTGGELMVLQLPVSQLPYAGHYDWTVSIYIGSLGEQCTHAGTFSVADGTDEP